ncbi:hypothetical protein AVEN_207598-1 [Araneus ventricosus]|uniref:Mos1 transposase HTH domain-containing protein n=1 Tax=Araneus ventricosus TaxID=182803 RepID=A0A4Y2RNX0_ARAVE|nr:hypothetical protein AVEN_207598-1 [Araneus ventricosus]
MFTTGDQRSWINIEVARGKNASECYHGLCEVCGDNALTYRTIARWVKAFCVYRKETAVLHRTGRPSIPQHPIDIASGILSIDHLWTVRKLPVEVGLSHHMAWYKWRMRSVAVINRQHLANGIL